ncbi:hypothetical protein RHMOL_Rhmol02G0164300 [Rhododendron molle]|uniref:Uncharacterized protein n=1 Tax=Rhododendron molle TaxID=49168 RepID=A0ACC0PR80_RHOML|nr:hypothetical protein RHMOL_Rhmol02G0164300 [Rhododendron molle]
MVKKAQQEQQQPDPPQSPKGVAVDVPLLEEAGPPPGLVEVEDDLHNLRIFAPSEGKPRAVRPPVTPPNEWHRVEHPKFPSPPPPLSRSQKRRHQRFRQAARRAAEETDLLDDPMIEDEKDVKGKMKAEVLAEEPRVKKPKAKRVHKPLKRTVKKAIIEPPPRTLPKKQVPEKRTYREAVTKPPPKQATVPKKQPLLERTLEEARIEPPPRQ